MFPNLAGGKPPEPPKPETEVEIPDEVAKVAGWRIECLILAGLESDAAGRLAALPDVDIHQAVSLLEHGCPRQLVEQILG